MCWCHCDYTPFDSQNKTFQRGFEIGRASGRKHFVQTPKVAKTNAANETRDRHKPPAATAVALHYCKHSCYKIVTLILIQKNKVLKGNRVANDTNIKLLPKIPK